MGVAKSAAIVSKSSIVFSFDEKVRDGDTISTGFYTSIQKEKQNKPATTH